MQGLAILIVFSPLLLFWLWMAIDFSSNPRIQNQLKPFWIIAFVFLNIITATYYYFTEYLPNQDHKH